jgi:F420H(2)-dependent quinone reductase
MAGVPALLLTTVGRRSGRPRQVSLYYLEGRAERRRRRLVVILEPRS